MPITHRGKALKKAIIWLRRSVFLTPTFSWASMPWTLEHVLGDIQTDRRNVHLDGFSCNSSPTITPWHCDTGSGRRPSHQTRPFASVDPHASFTFTSGHSTRSCAAHSVPGRRRRPTSRKRLRSAACTTSPVTRQRRPVSMAKPHGNGASCIARRNSQCLVCRKLVGHINS